MRCLPLAGTDETCTADLVQDGRRALLERWVDDVPLQCVDRLQLVAADRSAQLPGRRGCPQSRQRRRGRRWPAAR